ncbi:MAG: GNAT family N-acetyltransferase [Mesorhizobium sp.]|uniref:GNAT family N-acetyltransferase n=1 Tax=Mesorhizobium sp. TaxID=1871066 RepID=UPI000FE51637|nr:GNAT family N-acetyltransferase [Mesorhizobium sp.]RWL81909.1 MAG: GNAT family N-acetyltransferase [Mesorhizobium sp.]RWL82275.1 MAG: GNAT family N-acetyltransferase [Mesorhizobium sp.]RWL98660.1 MAG: GNAT family N-acetyltransferase [Mesorhizobium sp.]
MRLQAPVPLDHGHDFSSFSSGAAASDDWIKRRALANQDSGATRTFVACEDDRVLAYYALASGGVIASRVPGRFRRTMPGPIPVAILARLAIDISVQRQGIGRVLVQDAARRVMNAAGSLGIRGIVAHAVSDEARSYYTALGFDPSPLDPMTLVISLADLREAIR